MVYMLLGTGFEETEAVAPIDLLRRAGVSVATVGIGGKVITGSHGIPVTADMELGQMDLTQLDMIVLPGGMKGVASIKGCPDTGMSAKHPPISINAPCINISNDAILYFFIDYTSLSNSDLSG